MDRLNTNKKIAIWGTGVYASRFISSINIADVCFFIDSDRKKNGLFYKKRVLHPSQISEEVWKNLFIYIPVNYFDEMSKYLEKKGLRYKEDFIEYGHTLHITKARAERELDEYKDRIAKSNADIKTLIVAAFWRKYGYKNYFKRINKTDEISVLISESTAELDCEESENMGLLAIQAPIFSDCETIIDCDEEVGSVETEDLEIFDRAVLQMQGYFPKESLPKCVYNTWMKYQYIAFTLNHFKCDGVLCFSSTTVEHELLAGICRRKGIQVVFTHPGIIHGTLAFDVGGEMGESLPAMYPKEFAKLSVNKRDKDKAKEVWEFLYSSRINRKVQPSVDCISSIKKKYADGPIIFFAGQNDVGSHMVPYTEKTKKHHSPIFKSSIEAAVYLAELCEKNKWNFIYKPHPMYIHSDEAIFLPKSANYVEYGDINELIDFSDVVVTILSAVNYDALIRRRPVVTLGYMQSKGKGINYEAFRKEIVEKTIQEAILKGFSKEIENNFVVHLAQCIKYYLYDNCEEREVRYGMPFPDSYQGFFKLAEQLSLDNVD